MMRLRTRRGPFNTGRTGIRMTAVDRGGTEREKSLERTGCNEDGRRSVKMYKLDECTYRVAHQVVHYSARAQDDIQEMERN